MSSTRQTFPWLPEIFQRHLRNIGHGTSPRGRCSLTCPRCWHAPTAVSTRGVTRGSAVDSPRLKRPPLALDARDTDGWCYATSPSTYDAPCTNVRRESGRTGEPVQQATCHMHSARGGSLPCWGASHDERERLATVLDVASKITCTTALYHRSYWASYTASTKPLLRPVTAVEDWRGYPSLPPQVPGLGRHCQSSLLHCTHHICTGFRQSLTSWVPPITECSTRGTLYLSPRPGYGGFTALHMRTTATPKHGSTSGSPHCCCRITSG